MQHPSIEQKNSRIYTLSPMLGTVFAILLIEFKQNHFQDKNMQPKETNTNSPFQPMDDQALHEALTSLGRAINIVSTYGIRHPAFKQAIESCHMAMQNLFSDRKKISIGAINNTLTVDGVSTHSTGTLLKSLERRLVRLGITGLRIERKISGIELSRLVELLACNEAEEFDAGIGESSLSNITTENTRYEAVQADQTVANKGDLVGAGGNGILVLEDDLHNGEGGTERSGENGGGVHVDQIVAFLKGDVESDGETIGDELTKLAADPDRLGQMIMESVAIRQQASELSGESLSDVVLGCLRRTYDGLRKQPAFKTSEGVADLKKALLLLEESMLDKMRNLAGEANPGLDREIVQAIREMDENLGFELAASQYVEHRDAIELSKEQLKSYVQTKGAHVAEELLVHTDIPPSEWQRIVVESANTPHGNSPPPIADGLNTLAVVFEKLESLMKSDQSDEAQIQDLLGQATDNLGGTTDSTREKLDSLSKQLTLTDEDTGTIGGNARRMSRKELLSSIAEVAQELMQPLTAINASLEMLLSGYAGDVAPDQRNLLSLASSSGDDLNYLMQTLIHIVGIPTNRGVDKRFAIPHG